RRRFGRLFHGLRSLAGYFSDRFDPHAKTRLLGYDMDQLPPEYRGALEAGLATAMAYRPRCLDHPARLLKAQDAVYKESDPTIMWRRFVSRIEVEVVPGDHHTVLLPPGR